MDLRDLLQPLPLPRLRDMLSQLGLSPTVRTKAAALAELSSQPAETILAELRTAELKLLCNRHNLAAPRSRAALLSLLAESLTKATPDVARPRQTRIIEDAKGPQNHPTGALCANKGETAEPKNLE